MADFSFVDGNAPSATTWNSNVRDQLHVIATSSTRPSSPVTGRLIYETDTYREMIYDGSAWQQLSQIGAWTTYTPTWAGSVSNPAIGNGTLTARYLRLSGRTYLVQIYMLAGSTTTFGSGVWSFTTPSGLTASAYHSGPGFAVGATIWGVSAIATGTTFLPYTSTASGDVRLTSITSSAPFAWASTHYLTFSATIETTA